MTEPPRGVNMLPGDETVVAVVRHNGRCDARDFLHGLQHRYQARFMRYIERLATGMPIQSPEHIRRLSPAGTEPVVFELKADKYRLYLVRANSRWHATHGREKPKNSQVPAEIDKALKMYWEWKGHDS